MIAPVSSLARLNGDSIDSSACRSNPNAPMAIVGMQACDMITFLQIIYMQDGQTALIQSAAKGHLDIVELLLKYGANKEHQDKVNRACAANLFVVR